MTYTDALNNPINVGDFVVYAIRDGNTSALNSGIVDEIRPNERSSYYPEDKHYALTIIKADTGNKARVSNVENVAVVNA